MTPTRPTSPSTRNKTFHLLSILTVIWFLSAIAAPAATMVFVTAPGAEIKKDPVQAQVTFITGLNQVEIQIQNLQTDIGVDTQAISAIDWLLQNYDNSTTGQPTSVTLVTTGANLGTVINIAGSNTYTTTPLTSITSRWQLSPSTAEIAGGSQINIFSGGKPNQQIIGPPSYSANAGVIEHTPFLETSVDTHIGFMITYAAGSNVTSSTIISRARLSFGTEFASNVELDLIPGSATPEPGTVSLSLAGIALICLCLWPRRMKPIVPNTVPVINAQA